MAVRGLLARGLLQCSTWADFETGDGTKPEVIVISRIKDRDVKAETNRYYYKMRERLDPKQKPWAAGNQAPRSPRRK